MVITPPAPDSWTPFGYSRMVLCLVKLMWRMTLDPKQDLRHHGRLCLGQAFLKLAHMVSSSLSFVIFNQYHSQERRKLALNAEGFADDHGVLQTSQSNEEARVLAYVKFNAAWGARDRASRGKASSRAIMLSQAHHSRVLNGWRKSGIDSQILHPVQEPNQHKAMEIIPALAAENLVPFSAARALLCQNPKSAASWRLALLGYPCNNGKPQAFFSQVAYRRIISSLLSAWPLLLFSCICMQNTSVL